jgi:hypothetical protein
MSAFDAWIHDLERRQLADLRFADVSRGLRALSSHYVERRRTIHEGAALAGAGKRAAFALFYGPLHYLTVREIVGRLDAATDSAGLCVDLGCGTGAASVAWAEQAPGLRPIVAVDRHPWTLSEAARTFRMFDVRFRTERGDCTVVKWPPAARAFVAAFTVNELPEDARTRLLNRLVARASGGDAVLIVEPVARAIATWWQAWQAALPNARSDEWRFRPELPDIVARLDRAAGLRHRELTARSLWVPPRPR